MARCAQTAAGCHGVAATGEPVRPNTNGGTAEMRYYGYGWNWVGALIMMVFMALFMAGIIIVIIYALRGIGRAPHRWAEEPGEDRALATLRERYARGEIDDEEYERRRQRLSAATPPRP